MSQATTGKRRNRATNSYSARDRDGNRRREERYLLIAEIAASKKQTESYMEFAYGSNWDDR